MECCEYGNEPVGSIKWMEFIDYINNSLSSQDHLFCIDLFI
jgi:hypothetical protein